MKEKNRTTLKDIAKLTNVSVMTVSNVVNGKHQFVGKETRERVQKAIDELDYVPSATSRKLRSQKELTIGMIIMDEEKDFLINPFVGQLVAGLSNYLSEHNYALAVQGVKPSELEESTLFTHFGTDALCAILCGSELDRRESLEFMLRHHQPVVAFQESLSLRDSKLAIVAQNDKDGANALAQHVLKRGARKLLFVEPGMEWPAIRERHSGVIAAVRGVKGARLDTLQCHESRFEEIQNLVQEYFRASGAPDAVLGATDSIGIAALRFCQDNGFSVPKEILVTGFNGFEAVRYTNPPLTTVRSCAYDMGYYAGSLLLKRIESGRYIKRKTVFPVHLQPGGSA